MSEVDKAAMKESLVKEIAEVKENNQVKAQQINSIESQMSQIKDFVEKMCTAFRTNPQFKLAVASHMQYDEGTQFNENNVTVYLAELEEFISGFITFLAQREKNPDAPISALSLDAMTQKEFDKGPMAIDNVPNPNAFNNSFEDD